MDHRKVLHGQMSDGVEFTDQSVNPDSFLQGVIASSINIHKGAYKYTANDNTLEQPCHMRLMHSR